MLLLELYHSLGVLSRVIVGTGGNVESDTIAVTVRRAPCVTYIKFNTVLGTGGFSWVMIFVLAPVPVPSLRSEISISSSAGARISCGRIFWPA